MSNKYDHKIHKYKKIKLPDSGKMIFKCMLPNCSHYLYEELVEGRASICWRCGTEFIMTKAHMQLTKPHCKGKDCQKRYQNRSGGIFSTPVPPQMRKQLEGKA